MKTPAAWLRSLPRREPPYEDFFDTHPRLMWATLIASIPLAVVGAVGIVVTIVSLFR